MLDPQVSEHGPGVATGRMLRQFAGIWLVFFGGLAVWQRIVAGNAKRALILGGLAVTVGLLGLLKPPAIRPIYEAWMAVALGIGGVISRVVLAVLFYVVFMPVGVFFKLVGRDPLRLRRVKTDSYWLDKPQAQDIRRYLRQS